MREAFTAELTAIEERLDSALGRAVVTLASVADAVVDPTAKGSQAVAWSALQLRCASRGADTDLVTITARQAPVARDLRLVLVLIQIAQHVGLIANQFDLISQQLSDISGGIPDRQRTGDRLSEMAMLAGAQLEHAAVAFEARDLDAARAIEVDDDAIDRLNRVIFEAARVLDGEPDERALALRHVLIARSLERIGDNAVDIADQVPFLVTARLSGDSVQPRRRR
jgi:phosphate transport system protein